MRCLPSLVPRPLPVRQDSFNRAPGPSSIQWGRGSRLGWDQASPSFAGERLDVTGAGAPACGASRTRQALCAKRAGRASPAVRGTDAGGTSGRRRHPPCRDPCSSAGNPCIRGACHRSRRARWRESGYSPLSFLSVWPISFVGTLLFRMPEIRAQVAEGNAEGLVLFQSRLGANLAKATAVLEDRDEGLPLNPLGHCPVS